MRLLVASDLHASEGAWRKLLNAVRLGIWEADAVLVAGDLAGKALIPLVRSNGGWHGEQGGRELVARDPDELEALERSLADKGLYAIAVERGRARRPEGSGGGRASVPGGDRCPGPKTG